MSKVWSFREEDDGTISNIFIEEIFTYASPLTGDEVKEKKTRIADLPELYDSLGLNDDAKKIAELKAKLDKKNKKTKSLAKKAKAKLEGLVKVQE